MAQKSGSGRLTKENDVDTRNSLNLSKEKETGQLSRVRCAFLFGRELVQEQHMERTPEVDNILNSAREKRAYSTPYRRYTLLVEMFLT